MQYNLLVDAQGIAQWQAITGNQRLMCVLPIHHVNGIVMTIITPLFVGGSTVLNRAYTSQHFWERIARERVQIVSVVPTLLQFSLEYAEQQEQAGRSIWGDGVGSIRLAPLPPSGLRGGDAGDEPRQSLRGQIRLPDSARLRLERDDLLLLPPAD